MGRDGVAGVGAIGEGGALEGVSGMAGCGFSAPIAAASERAFSSTAPASRGRASSSQRKKPQREG